MMRYYWLIPRF